MTIESELLQRILEGALMASAKPLTIAQLAELFDEEEGPCPSNEEIRAALVEIQTATQGRGFELTEVSSGYRFQVVQEIALWIARLWEEKPQKYSRALLETLSLIAYRQPITRGDIEDVRGVAVSSNIIKTLQEREWIRVVGHKDVPGRPAMFATTRGFLDYFNLKNLEDLPSLAEIKDLDSMNEELALEGADTPDPETLSDELEEETTGSDESSELDTDTEAALESYPAVTDEDAVEDARSIDSSSTTLSEQSDITA